MGNEQSRSAGGDSLHVVTLTDDIHDGDGPAPVAKVVEEEPPSPEPSVLKQESDGAQASPAEASLDMLPSAPRKAVYPEEIGGTLGISASLESTTRVVAPAVGGALLSWARPWGPALFGGAMMVWVAVYMWQRLFVSPDPPLAVRSGQPEGAPR